MRVVGGADRGTPCLVVGPASCQRMPQSRRLPRGPTGRLRTPEAGAKKADEHQSGPGAAASDPLMPARGGETPESSPLPPVASSTRLAADRNPQASTPTAAALCAVVALGGLGDPGS